MSFEKRIKILKKQLGDKLNETLVRFYLTSGKEEVGIIEDLDNQYLILQTENGLNTIFELNGFKIEENQDVPLKETLLLKSEASKEKRKEIEEKESDEFIDQKSIDLIQKFLKPFNINKLYFETDIVPSDFSFPSNLLNLSFDKRESIKKDWDRIHNQFNYYMKVKSFNSLSYLADDLISLGTGFPKEEMFLYNAGCFLYEAENYEKALRIFGKAYKIRKKRNILFNIACAALKLNKFKIAYKAFSIFFKASSPISYINFWYVYCNLINQIQEYSGLLDIYDNIVQKISGLESHFLTSYKLEGDNDNDFILMCRTMVYLLQEYNKLYEALKIISYLEIDARDENKRRVIIKVRSLIESSLSILSGITRPDAAVSHRKSKIKKPVSKFDDEIIKKPSIDSTIGIMFSKGLVLKYNQNKKYGFIYDELDDETYYFNKTAIMDDELIKLLKKDIYHKKIFVYFEKSSSPRGLKAVKIVLYRPINEIYERAEKHAHRGEYFIAIAQMKKVINLNPDYLNANELYLKWREYSRKSSKLKNVPIGENPYALAKRADLIERDLEKAEEFYKKAINAKNNYESAIKDLADILNRLRRPEEAIELLEKYRPRVRNKLSIDNFRIHLYGKVGKQDKAADIIETLIKQTRIKEDKAKLLYQLGHIYLKQENYIKAKDSFEEILRLYPNNILAKRALALGFSKQKQYSKAEKILKEILEITPDNMAAELFDAISKARETGLTTYVDDIITETSASKFSILRSKFSQFFLENCAFKGVPHERIKIDDNNWKTYAGTEENANLDIQNLKRIVKTFGKQQPHEVANYYLSTARIYLDVKGESDQFYKFLSNSFTLQGDFTIMNNKPIDTARTWYVESLILYDKIRDTLEKEEVGINSLVKFLYSILGKSKIPINSNIPSLETTIKEIIKEKSEREKLFNVIGYLSLNSQYTMAKILPIIYNNLNIQKLALEYLEYKKVQIPSSEISLKEFINLWNEINSLIFKNIRSVVKILHTLNRVEMTTVWLEDAIERIKPLNFEGRLFFKLDQLYVLRLKEILEEALELCKKTAFEDRERLSIQIEQSCDELIDRIKKNPTKLSLEEILPIFEIISQRIQQDLEDLYETSFPLLSLRLPMSLDSLTPDTNHEITVQIVIENKAGCSPAESLELKVIEDKLFKLYKVKTPVIKLDESLRGNDSRIVSIPLKVSRKAIDSRTFSLPVYAKYRSRSSQFKKMDIVNFSINLYAQDKFKPIDNPYASYAEGGIVGNPKMFFGRDELIKNIKNNIIRDRAQNKCVMIFGQKRSGKSSILYHLKRRLKRLKDILIIDIKDIGVLLDHHSSVPLLYQILWSILAVLKKQVNKWIQKGYTPLDMQFPQDVDFYNHPTPVKYFSDLFDTHMSESYKNKDWKNVQIVLMIDEFSYIYNLIIKGSISENFMKIWKAILQRNYFSVVIAGQDVMQKFKDRFANEFGTSQDERVTYLKKIDARDLIDKPIRIPPFKIDGKTRYREKAIERIISLTAGSPFYIQIICNRLVEYMNRKHISLITEANVEEVKNELIKGVNAFRIDKFNNLIDSGDDSEDAINEKDILEVLNCMAKNSKTGPCTRASINCKTETPIDVILKDLYDRDVIERVSGNLYNIKVGLFKEWLIVNM